MKKLIPLAALPLLFMTSCGGGETETEAQKVDTTQEVVEVEEVTSFDLLPSPLQVASIFDKSGLKFDVAYCNDINAVSKYTTKFEKSLNFGAYSADLAYAVMNEKSKESGDIIKVVRDLSKEIGLTTVFESEDMLERFEKNISNKDSVMEILVEIQTKTDDYIEENGEHDLGTVMFTGAWIEGMYIGASATLKDNKSDVGATLAEQMIICGNLIKGLGVAEKTPECDELIASLVEIDDMYKNFESVKGLEGDEAYNVTLKPEEIKTLAEKLINLRNKIVKA